MNISRSLHIFLYGQPYWKRSLWKHPALKFLTPIKTKITAIQWRRKKAESTAPAAPRPLIQYPSFESLTPEERRKRYPACRMHRWEKGIYTKTARLKALEAAATDLNAPELLTLRADIAKLSAFAIFIKKKYCIEDQSALARLIGTQTFSVNQPTQLRFGT